MFLAISKGFLYLGAKTYWTSGSECVSRSESTEHALTCCVIDGGCLAHRKRPSGGAYKLPTGAAVKSRGIERVGKGLLRQVK